MAELRRGRYTPALPAGSRRVRSGVRPPPRTP